MALRTKIIPTRLFPDGKFAAITLFGIVFTPKGMKLTDRLVRHELIHCHQQLELLYIPFFIIYFAEWVWYMIKYRDKDKAYRAISFEREAYGHDADPEYLKHRRHYANFRKTR